MAFTASSNSSGEEGSKAESQPLQACFAVPITPSCIPCDHVFLMSFSAFRLLDTIDRGGNDG